MFRGLKSILKLKKKMPVWIVNKHAIPRGPKMFICFNAARKLNTMMNSFMIVAERVYGWIPTYLEKEPLLS